jgi:carbon-monoxide dehydrogenase large subunit
MVLETMPKFVGATVTRSEDPRFLTGKGRYVDDIRIPGTLHVAIVRSPVAHARIRGVDVSAAEALDGVVAVITGATLRGLVPPMTPDLGMADYHPAPQLALATDTVRFVGEPVAAVVAASRYVAEDAADLVEVDYEELPVVMNADAALADGSPQLHEDVPGNLVHHMSLNSGDMDAALSEADEVIRHTFQSHRHEAVPLEGRAVLASYDVATESLTVWTSSQIPHLVRTLLARLLEMPEHSVHVVAPDVGGGFGLKAMLAREELLIAAIARSLGRPVKWIEDRRENLIASGQAREEKVEVEVPVRRDGTILGLRARILDDIGAYTVYPFGGTLEGVIAVLLLPGPYHFSNFACELDILLTNKCPMASYRGIWGPITSWVGEGLLDLIARRLQLDPLEVRRRNLIAPGEFPFTSATGMPYENGTFVESLEKAADMIGYREFREKQRAALQQGRYIGLGFCTYVEPTSTPAIGMWGAAPTSQEMARIMVEPSGDVVAAVGVVSQGQGHATAFAQVVADELGVPFDCVRVVSGDTATSAFSMGTWGSRSAIVGSGALTLATRDIRTKILAIAAHMLEASPDDLEIRDATISVKGSPDHSVSLKDVAHTAYFGQFSLPEGVEPGLEVTRSYVPPYVTFSNGTHACIVEVDARMGTVRILRYCVVEDCGPMINPALVNGQIRGGTAQGIGGVLYEETIYDESGQPLTSTFLDYLLPTASEIPQIEIEHLETPSATLGGYKGMGESGAIAAPAAVINAVADALSPLGVEINRTPLTPERILSCIERARRAGQHAHV